LDTILIAGLGNPGPSYRGTWHNLGYRVLEKLATRFRVEFLAGKGEYLFSSVKFSGRDVLMVKPTSYMNLSGRPILQLVEQEDIFHENILAICDDINLPLGKIRLRGKGSEGGHKGLSSLIYYLGTENFPRIRMGIATEEEITDLKYHVLLEIPERYSIEVDMMLEKTADAVEAFIEQGLTFAMNKFNSYEEYQISEANS
jgi:PTH1 family peptidyl-tRNA hydrolase